MGLLVICWGRGSPPLCLRPPMSLRCYPRHACQQSGCTRAASYMWIEWRPGNRPAANAWASAACCLAAACTRAQAHTHAHIHTQYSNKHTCTHTHTLHALQTAGADPLQPDEIMTLGRLLPSMFVFSVVWSLGASCDKAGRPLFDRLGCSRGKGGLLAV